MPGRDIKPCRRLLQANPDDWVPQRDRWTNGSPSPNHQMVGHGQGITPPPLVGVCPLAGAGGPRFISQAASTTITGWDGMGWDELLGGVVRIVQTNSLLSPQMEPSNLPPPFARPMRRWGSFTSSEFRQHLDDKGPDSSAEIMHSRASSTILLRYSLACSLSALVAYLISS